jgi:S-adenosylmethionine synthetase
MADQISDAILDEALKQDKNSHIACETMLTAKKVIIA